MSTPYRSLSVTDPLTEGDDVLELQRAHNARNGKLGYGLPHIPEDGVFGGVTLSLIRGEAGVKARRGTGYYLGAPDVVLGKGKPINLHLQIIVRDPAQRTLDEKRRGKLRYIARRAELVHVAPPGSPRYWTRKQAAAFLIEQFHKGRIRGWNDLSTGNDIPRRLQEVVDRGQMYVPRTGRWVYPSVWMLRGLAASSQVATFGINALTGGVHSSSASHHYIGTADDTELDDEEREIETTNARYGGRRNFETSHNHTDWPT